MGTRGCTTPWDRIPCPDLPQVKSGRKDAAREEFQTHRAHHRPEPAISPDLRQPSLTELSPVALRQLHRADCGGVDPGQQGAGSRFRHRYRVLKKCLAQGLPDRKAGNSSAPRALLILAGAIAPAKVLRWDQDQPGAKAPGQRPTRPRRALRPRRVGRWPSAVRGPAGLQGTVPRGRGKRGSRFLFPPGEVKAPSHCSGRGYRPCHSAALILVQPGATAPGQRPTRPRRALLARRVRRWPVLVPDLPVYRAPCRAGGETRVAFPVPARTDECTVTAAMAGAIAPATVLRRDHDRPGAQSPRPAPDPAGASHPPGRALAFRGAWTDRSIGHRPARAGETRVAFPDPAHRGNSFPRTGKISRQAGGRIAVSAACYRKNCRSRSKIGRNRAARVAAASGTVSRLTTTPLVAAPIIPPVA